MWKRKRKKTLFITAEIDQDGILGKINELEEIIEDMKFVLVGLKKDFHFKEEPTTDAGATDPTSESVADEAAEKLAEKLSNISSHI